MNWTTIEAHLPNLVQKYMKEANIAFMKHLGVVWPLRGLRSVHYRIRFHHIQQQQMVGPFAYPFDTNEITVTHIRFTRFWSPPEYPEDYPYTTDFHHTPQSSP